MIFLVKEEDMPTAPLEQLRISKRRCDRLRNFFSGFGILPIVIHGIVIVMGFIGGNVVKYSPFELLFEFFTVMLGALAVVLSVLAKEEQKFFPFAVASILLYGASGWINWREYCLLFAVVSLAMLSVAMKFCDYNEKLMEIDGYPYFKHHNENRSFESVTRTRANEIAKYGAIVDAEKFFEKDFQELKDEQKPKIDKTHWLGS